MWKRLEANRILDLWRDGRAEGVTPELIAWCLFHTGDAR
jgi:hypothetical protein